ncbi:MAG: hypothetical protein ABI374_01900 [Ginsengibacter sp.]
MWTLITDCNKQLTIHSKIREKNDAYTKLYEIIEVESDQYKLSLVEKNDLRQKGEGNPLLNCLQLKKYAFEVEQKG